MQNDNDTLEPPRKKILLDDSFFHKEKDENEVEFNGENLGEYKENEATYKLDKNKTENKLHEDNIEDKQNGDKTEDKLDEDKLYEDIDEDKLDDDKADNKLYEDISEDKLDDDEKEDKLNDDEAEDKLDDDEAESRLDDDEAANKLDDEAVDKLDDDEDGYKLSDDEDEASRNSENEELPTNVDSYSQHFSYTLSDNDGSGKLNYQSRKVEWPEIGKFVHMKPVLQNTLSKEPLVSKTNIADFQLKKNLLDAILGSSALKKMSKMQIGFLNLLVDYFDILFLRRTHENGEKLRLIYNLHILNHILKSRAKVIHHNSKIKKNPNEEYRDQGFTRPVSLILVPFRNDCYRIIAHLTSLLPECVVMNRKRFETEYGPPPPRQRIKKKPQDYEETFEGNINEDFKIGLKIKNKSMTLYSEFYSSDLIIASPLGLRQIVGAEGDKDRDFDFLSSVEILVIDRAEVLMLQNPVHLLHVLKHFNLLPKESHGCNFFRVREYALNGMSKYYRQNILLSSVEHIWFEALIFQNICFNYSGYLVSGTDVKCPAIRNVLVPMKMCFRWFETETPETEIEDRFNYFINKVLPDYKDKAMLQTMIYIPSYFDFVRLRNYFRENELSSVMVCEYSKKGKIAQARDVFFKGHRHFMLYTERAHFYSRYHIKGIQHILFYQPPTYPGFFRELCNLLMDSNPRRKFEEKSCCVLATKHDILQLKHVVGLSETRHMFNSKKKIFVKYTD